MTKICNLKCAIIEKFIYLPQQKFRRWLCTMETCKCITIQAAFYIGIWLFSNRSIKILLEYNQYLNYYLDEKNNSSPNTWFRCYLTLTRNVQLSPVSENEQKVMLNVLYFIRNILWLPNSQNKLKFIMIRARKVPLYEKKKIHY